MISTLGPGERILWQGTPVSGIRFTAPDIFAIPFTLVWLGLVCGIGATASFGATDNADPMAMFILPLFVLVGLYMLIGRFVFEIVVRRNTHYTLTNRRALIESGVFSRSTRSVTLAATAEITFREGRNGRGTIEFGAGAGGPFGMMPRNWPGAGRYMSPAFDGIEDAGRVYALALEGQRAI